MRFTMVFAVAMLCVGLGAAANAQISTDPDDSRWRSGFHRTGFDERVYDFTLYNGELVACGMFTRAGGTVADLIARWDGTDWRTLGAGIVRGKSARSLAVHEDELVVGGFFVEAGGVEVHSIAAWDGAHWYGLGDGMNSFVNALCVYRDTLIAGGTFTEADGQPVSGLAFWDGSSWHAYTSGVSGVSVDALAVFNGSLIVAGDFDTLNGVAARNIATWDGTQARPLGEGATYTVNALAVLGEDLIAGAWGEFTVGLGRRSRGIAAWNGSTWRDIGSARGTSVPGVTAMLVHEGRLIVGGYFTEIGGVPADNAAVWDGAQWQPMARGLRRHEDSKWPPISHTIFPFGGELWFGGEFLFAGEAYTPAIARWTGDSWRPVSPGDGIPGLVYDVEPYNEEIVVGGGFPWAGDEMDAKHIALWNGSRWEPLGSGTDSLVTTVQEFQGDLIVAGEFLHASGTPANRVARWDGTTWHPMGDGFDARVWDLLEHNGILYAGGEFVESGSIQLNHVARWNGTGWVPVGPGFDEAVITLDVHQDTLLAGGVFSSSGLAPVKSVAKWDGERWRSIGDLSMAVHAMTTFRGDLFVGGGSPYGLLRWNGTNWEDMLPEQSNVHEVNALRVLDDKLFVGGLISRVGGVVDGLPVSNVIRWDGIQWSRLGSGVDNLVLDFGSQGGSLLVGGGFGVAGDKGSAGFAIWDEVPSGIRSGELQATRTGSGVMLTWDRSSYRELDVYQIRVQRATTQAGPFTERAELAADATHFDDPEVDAGSSYWYRLLVVLRGGGSSIVGPVLAEALQAEATGRMPHLSVANVPEGMLIRYRVEVGPTRVTLGVFDVRGRRIIQLEQGPRPAGDYVRVWDTFDSNGVRVPSGVYLVSLTAGAIRASSKCNVLR